MSFANFLTVYTRKIQFCVLAVLFCSNLSAHSDSLSFWEPAKEFSKNRAIGIGTLQSVGAVGTLSFLSYVWYSDYNTSSFRLFNDFNDWRGMDKLGHYFSAFYMADFMHQSLRWAGVKKNKSLLISSISSFAYLTSIEILDGYSEGWGFSIPDAVMNTAGLLGFALQNYVDPKKNVQLKFAFVPSDLRQYRPSLLGENNFVAGIKDYNGQTYWLSFNLAHFTKIKKMPTFINLAFGYGAGGLLGGNNNPEFNEQGLALPNIERYSRFFLSGDIQWRNIKTKNHYMRLFLNLLSCYKLPFPALEYNSKNQFKFNWIR
jgi:hypothetical protein